MAKPFKLHFEFTPKWHGNRERSNEEKFTVTLRDFSRRKQIETRQAAFENVSKEEPATDSKELTNIVVKNLLDAQLKDIELQEAVLRKQVVSVNGLSIEDESGLIQIKTADDVIEHCPTLGEELSLRLFSGPDEEELKN